MIQIFSSVNSLIDRHAECFCINFALSVPHFSHIRVSNFFVHIKISSIIIEPISIVDRIFFDKAPWFLYCTSCGFFLHTRRFCPAQHGRKKRPWQFYLHTRGFCTARHAFFLYTLKDFVLHNTAGKLITIILSAHSLFLYCSNSCSRPTMQD